MSSPSAPPPAPSRPRQVTLAAWLIMGGSVLVVATAFQRVSGLHSLETRQAVERFLAGRPGSDLGITTAGVLDTLRVVSMVAAGCATAAAILGYHVLQRSRSARVALSVLALPLFVTGLATGGFLASVVAAASVMLGLQPARDWFAGREPAAGRPEAPAPPRPVWPPQPWDRGPRSGPAAGQGSGEGPGGAPAEHLPRLATDPDVRPPALAWACGLTWVFAGLTVVLMCSSIALLATDPGLVFDELHRQDPQLAAAGLTDDVLRTASFVVGGLLVAWSLAALVLGVLAWRRVRWARVALLVSAAASAVGCLLASVGQFVMLLPLTASVVTLVLLVRPDVRAWFDRR